MRQIKIHLRNKFFGIIVIIHVVIFIFLLSPLPLTKSIDEQLYPLLLAIFSFMVSVFQTIIKSANEEKPLSISHKIGLAVLTIFTFIILFIAYYGTSGNSNDKISILSVFVVTGIIFLWTYKFLYHRLVMIPMDKKYAKVTEELFYHLRQKNHLLISSILSHYLYRFKSKETKNETVLNILIETANMYGRKNKDPKEFYSERRTALELTKIFEYLKYKNNNIEEEIYHKIFLSDYIPYSVYLERSEMKKDKTCLFSWLKI